MESISIGIQAAVGPADGGADNDAAWVSAKVDVEADLRLGDTGWTRASTAHPRTSAARCGEGAQV